MLSYVLQALVSALVLCLIGAAIGIIIREANEKRKTNNGGSKH